MCVHVQCGKDGEEEEGFSCLNLWPLHKCEVCGVCRDASSSSHHQLLLLPNLCPHCQVQTVRQQPPGCPRVLGVGFAVVLQDLVSFPKGDNCRQTHMWSRSKTSFILLNSSFYVLKIFRGKKGLFQKITPCFSISAALRKSFKMEIRTHYCTFN